MRYFIIFFVNITLFTAVEAQKPVIDSSVYGKWPSLEEGNISDDGNYVHYVIRNQPVDGATSIVRSTKNNWKFEFPEALYFSFSADGRFVYFALPGDTLCKLTLGEGLMKEPGERFGGIVQKAGQEWLIYQKVAQPDDLFFRSLVSTKEKVYHGVLSWWVTNDPNVMIFRSRSADGHNVGCQWVNLLNDQVKTLGAGGNVGEIIFDEMHHQMVYKTEDSVSGKLVRRFWHYKESMEKGVLIAGDEDIIRFGDRMQLGRFVRFNQDGKSLFFGMIENLAERPQPDPQSIPVTVWSYKDTKLQTRQMQELKEELPKEFLSIINLDNHQIVRVQQEDENDCRLPPFSSGTNDFALINQNSREIDGSEYKWSKQEKRYYLVSAKDETRKLIFPLDLSGFTTFFVSPEGKYILTVQRYNLLSYDVQGGKVRNITAKMRLGWNHMINTDSLEINQEIGFIVEGWVKGDSAVLLWDRSDLWQVDLKGSKPPLNLTNGYGRRHHVAFRMIQNDDKTVIDSNDTLFFCAFDHRNKENGFYKVIMGRKQDPELLSRGPYLYYWPDNIPDLPGERPKKAKNAHCWLVKRMSASEFPNYFSTIDFKTFVPLSQVYPERAWNWVRTELIDWKMPDEGLTQGVLYKPENFDPKKKYPIIFYYYEKLSDMLHAYQNPEPSLGWLNIVQYVSNGYLVCTPDIHYTLGNIGENVVNSVLSAANYLSKMPWIDAKRMGIQGFSLGGNETNYLVTHSNLFAAACSGGGVVDLISFYGSISNSYGSSHQEMTDGIGLLRLGVPLWQRPDLYIKNSPIFSAKNMTTPLLLMHTTSDGASPFANIMEFFTELRRLGKPVWLLQYDGEEANHGVWGRSGADFTIRMQQFFDHYLKGQPAPKWMVEGIPARMKGIETGLKLESGGDYELLNPQKVHAGK